MFFGLVLCYSLYSGLKNGFFIELASLLSLVIGIFMAIKFLSFVTIFLQNQLGWTSKFVQAFAFLITFLLVVVGIKIAAKLFTKIASAIFLGWANRLGGALFSVLKMVLMLSVFLNLFQKININNFFVKQQTLNDSVFYNPIQEVAKVLYPSLTHLYDNLKTEVKN